MKINGLMGAILTTVVVLVMVTAVILPIIETSEDSMVNYTKDDNTGFAAKYSRGTSSYGVTIEPVSSTADSATFKINGSNVTLSGDTIMVWLYNNGGVYLSATASRCLVSSVGSGSTAFNFSGDEGVSGVNSVTFADGSMTQVNVSGQRTAAYSWIIHPDTDGDLALFTSGGFHVSNSGSYYAFFFDVLHGGLGYGNATSMTKAMGYSGTTVTYTPTASASDTYYTVTSVAITYDGSSVSTTGYIAPVEYNSGVEEGTQNIVNDIVAIIPIVLIVSIIVMAVGFVVRRD